jgi:predicted heme/steroid binding protein
VPTVLPTLFFNVKREREEETGMLKLTREELSVYDGKEGRRTYVAFEGSVYDVTDSFLWKEGNHQGIHPAGRDLTDEMAEAPHGADVFEMFEIIGVLIET